MSTEKLQFYRCQICGNTVQVILGGGPVMHCCGQEMEFLKANTNDEADTEKHVPVITETESNGCEIKVGAIPHPMIEEHHIMFIEAITEDKNCVYLKYLYPGEEPKMIIEKYSQNMCAKEYCNIHGLWENKHD